MKAIQVVGKGDRARLELGAAPEPVPGPREVLIDVVATAVNRADVLQRKGLYPPPPGASDVLGLECSGVIAEVGEDVTRWEPGQRVCALLPGGGYAERAVADTGSIMAVPANLSLTEAAGLPEVFLTCSLNLFQLADVESDDWVLVHGGGSGIGTAAIQMLNLEGIGAIVTAGSEGKCEKCLELGADVAINYRDGEFVEATLAATGGEGVDAILDSIGGLYLEQHVKCLATDGRLVVIGLMGGAKAELDMGMLLRKRLSIMGSTLRTRGPEEKSMIVDYFVERFGSAVEGGELAPVVHRVLPLAEAQKAHEILEESSHFGKLVLAVREEQDD